MYVQKYMNTFIILLADDGLQHRHTVLNQLVSTYIYTVYSGLIDTLSSINWLVLTSILYTRHTVLNQLVSTYIHTVNRHTVLNQLVSTYIYTVYSGFIDTLSSINWLVLTSILYTRG